MDYLTHPTSKKALRKMAREFRSFCDVSQQGPFPVLFILERLRDLFFGCDYIVLPDNQFPKKTMARCKENDMGGYTIEIKESVYNKAYEGSGAHLGFICHELCHVYLFNNGFKPIYEKSFKPHSLRPFESVEWQAMYLCGETMIPYKESIGMSQHEIINYYHVSKSYAKSRVDMN